MVASLPSVGRLAEHIVMHKLALWLQAVRAEDMPQLLERFDRDSTDNAAFEIHPSDAEPCWAVFASAPFTARRSQPLARYLGLSGDRASKRDHMRAAGELLAARAFGDSLRSIRLSPNWASLDPILPLSSSKDR